MTYWITWMVLCKFWPRRRHIGRKTYTLLWRLHDRNCLNCMLISHQQPVCFRFQCISVILSVICNHLGSRTSWSILILRKRCLILPNPRRPFWSMCRTNIAPNIDKCLSLNLKSWSTATFLQSAKASGIGHSFFDPYDMSSDNDKNLTLTFIAERTPRRSDRAVRVLTATRFYLNFPPESPKNWGQVNPNVNR